MPQMSPMLWLSLYFYSLFLLLFMMILIYFMLIYYNNYLSNSIKIKLINYKWFW